MNAAARMFAAMLIAQPLLVSASISTSTSAEIQVSGSTVQNCTNTGVTFSTCSATLVSSLPSGMVLAFASAQSTSGWNSFSFQYENFNIVPDTLPISRAFGTVSDVLTVHGGTGSAVLLLSFVGQVSNPSGMPPFGMYTVTANGSSNGVLVFPDGTLRGWVEVPFTFEVAFPLTFGWTASFAGAPDFERLGIANLVLQVPAAYTRFPITGPPGAPLIAGTTFTRESGAPLGIPEPASILLCAGAFGLLRAAARRFRR